MKYPAPAGRVGHPHHQGGEGRQLLTLVLIHVQSLVNEEMPFSKDISRVVLMIN
jgi:hypothetical protein